MRLPYEGGIEDGSYLITTFEELDVWFVDCLTKIRLLDKSLQEILFPALIEQMQAYHEALIAIRGGYDGHAKQPMKREV
jgi:hypothetical protein